MSSVTDDAAGGGPITVLSSETLHANTCARMPGCFGSRIVRDCIGVVQCTIDPFFIDLVFYTTARGTTLDFVVFNSYESGTCSIAMEKYYLAC